MMFIKLLKSIVKSNVVLTNLIKPFVDKSLFFRLHQQVNRPFNYKVDKDHLIRLMPTGQIAQGIFSGWFETNELNLFKRFMRPGMCVVDAGANIGLYSIVSAKLVGRQGRVISFEPSKETFDVFSSNIKLNRLANIHPINMGLGDTVNKTLHLLQEVGNGDAERYIRPASDSTELDAKSYLKREEIYIDTVDNVLGQLSVDKVDFIKIDTEGFEYYILKGARETIMKNEDIIIMMECTEPGTRRANTTQIEVVKLLKDYGLNVYYRDGIHGKWGDDINGALKAPDGMFWACKNINQLTSLIP